MKREVFSITTSESYTSVGGLLAQTGQDRRHWRHVALKELVDNALDAAESTGIAPAVLVEITESPTGLTLAVTDNGSGIPADVVARLADFTAFISDKAAYRAPLRGAQGNAIKTLLGMPVALSDDRRSTTEIIACGVRHCLRVQASPTGAVRCEHSTEATDAATGTRLSIAIPGAVDRFNWQPDRWVIAYALFNPHAQLQIRKTDDCSGGYSAVTVRNWLILASSIQRSASPNSRNAIKRRLSPGCTAAQRVEVMWLFHESLLSGTERGAWDERI